MTYFDMDSSGRFVLTGTSKTFQIWTTSGELINKDMFSTEIQHVHFRPRYLTKLSTQEENKLEEREKDIKKKYEEEDEKRLNALEYERKKEREEKMARFKKYLADKKEKFAQVKPKRDQIRGFNEEDPKVKSGKYEYQYRENNGN